VEKIANSDSAVAKRLIKLFEISRKDKTDKQEMKKIKSSVQARKSIFGVIKRQHSSQVLKIVEESKEESKDDMFVSSPRILTDLKKMQLAEKDPITNVLSVQQNPEKAATKEGQGLSDIAISKSASQDSFVATPTQQQKIP